jgi:hypothetical protein
VPLLDLDQDSFSRALGWDSNRTCASSKATAQDRPMSFRPNRSLTIDDHSQGAMTMKLTAMLFLTLDGVYQGPGAPDEEIGRPITSVYERADALLLGRVTWENSTWTRLLHRPRKLTVQA